MRVVELETVNASRFIKVKFAGECPNCGFNVVDVLRIDLLAIKPDHVFLGALAECPRCKCFVALRGVEVVRDD